MSSNFSFWNKTFVESLSRRHWEGEHPLLPPSHTWVSASRSPKPGQGQAAPGAPGGPGPRPRRLLSPSARARRAARMFASAHGAGAPQPGCGGEAARSGSASARRVTDLHRLGPPSGPGASRGSPTALPRPPPRGWQSAGQQLSLSGVAPASSQCPWVPSSSPPSPCPSVWWGALTSSRRSCAGALANKPRANTPPRLWSTGARLGI